MKAYQRLCLFSIFLLLALVVGCTRKVADVTTGNETVKIKKVSQLIELMDSSLKSYDSAEIKGRFSYNPSKGMGISGRFILRQKQDEAVWISARKFGLEGARVFANTDSVFVLNRLEKSYIAESHEVLKQRNKFSDLPIDLSLSTIFQIIDTKLDRSWDKAKLKKKDQGFILENIDKGQKMVIAQGVVPLPDSVSYLYNGDQVLLIFKNYKQLADGTFFPYKRNLKVTKKDGEVIQVDLNYDTIDDNTELKYPFQIPRSYKPMEY